MKNDGFAPFENWFKWTPIVIAYSYRRRYPSQTAHTISPPTEQINFLGALIWDSIVSVKFNQFIVATENSKGISTEKNNHANNWLVN